MRGTTAAKFMCPCGKKFPTDPKANVQPAKRENLMYSICDPGLVQPREKPSVTPEGTESSDQTPKAASGTRYDTVTAQMG